MPVLEPSDDLVHRLATTARASRPAPSGLSPRQRVAVAVAAFVGLGAASVSGAWAVGAIEVPGVPDSPLRSRIVDEPRPAAPGGTEPESGGGASEVEGDPPVASREDDSGTARELPPVSADVVPRVRPTAPGRPQDPGEQGRDKAKDKEKGSGAAPDTPRETGKGKDKQKERETGRPDDAGAGRGQGDERRAEKGRPAGDESVDPDE